MKASIAHGIRPSALILGKDSKKPWGQWDILLAKAYQRFLSELCNQCGLPTYLCHNNDSRIQFKIVRDECAATAVSEREQEKMAKAKSPNFGMKVFAEPKLTPDAIEAGLEFSDFRRPYNVERAIKLGMLPEDTKIPTP